MYASTAVSGMNHTHTSNTTTNIVGASVQTAEDPTVTERMRLMKMNGLYKEGDLDAQSNTTTHIHKRQDPLDWLVRHCSPSLVVSCPDLTRRYGDQSDPAGERAGRTVMDWCRLRQQVFDRQNHGGLSCTAHQSQSTATESHGRWKTIWSRFSSGITAPSWVTRLSSIK